jgi:hypothetical protein
MVPGHRSLAEIGWVNVSGPVKHQMIRNSGSFFLAAVLILGLCAAQAEAHFVFYEVTLTGGNLAPANNSAGRGTAKITVDYDSFTLRVQVEFSGLEGDATSAHIHAPTAIPHGGDAIIATQTPSFDMFPAGGTGGTYDHTFDLGAVSTYNPDFIAWYGGDFGAAIDGFLRALLAGKGYLDIHTTAYPDGEVRGFLLGPTVQITGLSTAAGAENTVVTLKGVVDPAGVDVFLEKTSDLHTWSFVQRIPSNAETGEFTFTVLEPAGTGAGFYRANGIVGVGEERPARPAGRSARRDARP